MDILRGLNLPPFLVSLARGLIEAAIIGALGAAVIFLGEIDISQLPDGIGPVGLGIAVWVLRALEGLADQIDPAKVRK